MERLDKAIASQGVGTRSQVHKLIQRGRVKINGTVERKIDRKIDPEKVTIEIDGVPLVYRRHVYIMLNKPAGVISASNDPHARTVIDLLPAHLRRDGLFPVGRLDKDTEGLLIITDDGEFAHRITSPNKSVFKTYHALLDGRLTKEDIEKIEAGLEIDGGEVCRSGRARMLSEETCLAQIEICEGKYHQVKRMMQALGLKVLHLRRVASGALMLDESLASGECRELSEEERSALLEN